MALTTCEECGNQVSDQAASCPKCGYPILAAHAPGPSASVLPEPEPSSGVWIKWVLIVPVVLFGLVMCVGSMGDSNSPSARARSEAARNECAKAMASSIGHSTVGYADQAAYAAQVKSKCEGFEINGKPVVP